MVYPCVCHVHVKGMCILPLMGCRRKWQPTPRLLPRESHGQRSLVGYSPWGREESDTLEWLNMQTPTQVSGLAAVQSLSDVRLFAAPRMQHSRLPYPPPTSRVCSNSCRLSQWCHPTISSSVIPFSSCLLFFPPSGSFKMSWLFISGGHSNGASDSASVLRMNIQGWFHLELTGWISLQSKGLSRVFSNITVQKHQSFDA